jgi:uncharacterized protein (DUF1810 family)
MSDRARPVGAEDAVPADPDRGPGRLDAARFLQAHDADGVHDRALAELRAGRKRTHWMWFVFPQLAGLGTSPTAKRYAIETVEVAREYLAHPVLGGRLRAAARVVLDAPAESAEQLLGAIDAVKLRSSMTLFAAAATGADAAVFTRVLDRWYSGRPDPRTLELLGGAPGPGRCDTAGSGEPATP